MRLHTTTWLVEFHFLVMATAMSKPFECHFLTNIASLQLQKHLCAVNVYEIEILMILENKKKQKIISRIRENQNRTVNPVSASANPLVQ